MKWYAAELQSTIGEYEVSEHVLLRARTRESAERKLDKLCKNYYDGRDPGGDGEYSFHGGAVVVCPGNITELSAEGAEQARRFLSDMTERT